MEVDGPEITDHVPVPLAGAVAARVTDPVMQVDWSPPAEAVAELYAKVTVSVDGGHPALVIDHCRVYTPAPPAGVKVEVGEPVLLNCAAEVLGPLTTDQRPVPTLGVLAANVA